MGQLSVPTIDISPLISPNSSSNQTKSQVLSEIRDACQQWGFFYVINHGVDLKLVEKASQLGKQFFNMPKSFKDTVRRREV